jgi:hypothetical protein
MSKMSTRAWHKAVDRTKSSYRIALRNSLKKIQQGKAVYVIIPDLRTLGWCKGDH